MATANTIVDPTRMMTPPEVGRRLRIKAARVISLIRSGELRASDLSSAGSRRPRFRISPVDLQIFLDRRSATPVAKAPRRRLKNDGITQYF